MISTRNLIELPDVDGLRRLLQSLAMLDAILSPEWEDRYYSFDSAWSPGEQMGSMRNGSGDEFFAHFSGAGCWLKGFAHESPMSPFAQKSRRTWPGVLDAVPAEFAACLKEPAFQIDETTYCIWRRPRDKAWQVGPVMFPPNHPDPDGSEMLLSILNGNPATYRSWAAEYYEREIELVMVLHIYRHLPLASKVVTHLNPDLSLDDLADDIVQIGYATGVGQT